AEHRNYEAFRRLNSDDVRKLADAAEVLKRLAEQEDEHARELPERARGNAMVRAVTGELVKACRIIFGASHYRIVARIASVMLGTEVSASTVRTWHPSK